MKRGILFVILLMILVTVYAQGPHPMYIEIRNAQNEIPVAGDISFEAWLLSNPQEVLDENVTDCYYPAFGSTVKVNCGQFSTWTAGDILHLDVLEISSGDMGTGEYVLTFDASQFFWMEDGGIYLGGAMPPDIELPEEFSTDEDVALSIDFATYISGIYSGITASGGENINVSIIGSMVTFSTAENWNGSELISFEVTGIEENDSDSVIIVVNPVNDPPDLNMPAQFQFNEDSSFSEDISQYASDVEGDILSYAVTGSAHITAEITGSQLNLSAEANWNGTEYITIMVSDDQRRETTTIDMMVIVNPMNDAPVLDIPEQLTFQAGTPAVIDFSQFMDDIDGDILTISVYGEDDLEVEITGSNVTFNYPQDWHGSEELIFTVDDNVFRLTASDTVMINIFYPEDTILSCQDYEINDGQSLTVPIYTTEIFEGWSLPSYELHFAYDPTILTYNDYSITNTILSGGVAVVEENEPGYLVINYANYLPMSGAGALIELEFEAVCFGDSPLDIVLCMMGAQGLSEFIDGEVIVNDIGLAHPPVADAGDNFGVVSGSEGTLDGSGSFDPDGDDITYLWDSPAEIVISEPTSAITQFTAPIVMDDTDFIVTLTVSDGQYFTSDFVVVTVNYMNHAPEIALPAEFNFAEDELLLLDFSEYVNDIDEDNLSLAVTGNENIIVSFDDLEVELSAAVNWNGSETLTFIVSDNIQRLEAEADVVINVSAVNDQPHADAGMNSNGRDGEVISLDGSASWDVETEELEYIWIAPAGVMLSDPYAVSPTFTAPQVVDPTEYEFTLQVSDGELQDEDSVIITIQDDEPVLLNVELLPENNALFTWFAPGSGGSGEELDQGFEGIILPQGWLNIDHDGDGYGWYIYVQSPHSGSSSAGSQSYHPTSGALTPDNWLISPEIEIGGLSELRFWMAAQDEFYPQEHFAVLVSDSGTAIDNFQETLVEETLENDNWIEYSISLTAWAGSSINIAWRHYDVTDQFILKLDDVQVINTATRAVEFSADFNSGEAIEFGLQSGSRNRDLLGYNVFLDNVSQGFVESREYLFENVVGEHVAGVQAVYDYGVSEIVDTTFNHTANDLDIPLITGLNRIYPNPFNPETRIEFSLAEPGNVLIEVYNVKGQKVKVIMNADLAAGNHEISWQADNCASGIYFLSMRTRDYTKTEKLILLK
ncbi:MAG: choice-of-anchor J domain-containing protein [Candidatus Cloacimonetes bacterium]|nr:choice-of-anchor J domain-containing protein [Candidatus Cloacimonadota bacterium]